MSQPLHNHITPNLNTYVLSWLAWHSDPWKTNRNFFCLVSWQNKYRMMPNSLKNHRPDMFEGSHTHTHTQWVTSVRRSRVDNTKSSLHDLKNENDTNTEDVRWSTCLHCSPCFDWSMCLLTHKHLVSLKSWRTLQWNSTSGRSSYEDCLMKCCHGELCLCLCVCERYTRIVHLTGS